MLFGAIFLWAFIGTSLVLCSMFLEEYSLNHGIGRFVLGSSILASLFIAAGLTVIARKFAFPRILGSMAAGSYSDFRIGEIFTSLSRRMEIGEVELREAKLGNAFSVGIRGRKIVAVSPSLLQSLSDEESESVLAHELSHFKNRDALAKGLARLARFAFPFDPFIRLLEAAIHRERELLADRASVGYTGKPLALASALIKAYSGPEPLALLAGAGLFVGGSRRRWLNLYPDLELRVEMLLTMANRRRVMQEVQPAMTTGQQTGPSQSAAPESGLLYGPG
jgi:heat shock protein HtpX